MRKKRAKTTAAKRQRSVRRAPPKHRRGPSPRAIEATLAEVAHDIRTPLTGILALGELLASSELAERERGWAVAIKNTAEHLALLTSLIVDAARAAAKGITIRRGLVRPRRLAEAVGASLAARAEAKGLTAETVIAADLPQAAIGDALRLRSALENLIDNAVKFTERGTVRLEVSAKPVGRGRTQLIFAVTDSGIGLSAAEIRRLFKPFAQANERIAHRYGGAGLGLAFVRRIAQAMGGELSVTSKPGGGSRFQLSVRVEELIEAEEGEGDAAPAAAARALHILCAEDNPYGRVVLNTILTELGHRADFVGTGEAVVEAVARGAYDAVLMDVTLPGMDGVEATRRIRALTSPAAGVPIIGISGRSSAQEEARAQEAGMNGYLAKPISPRALAAALATLPAELP